MVTSADAIYNPHLRLTWGGTIGVPGVEQWTNGLRFVDFTDGDFPSDGELQEAVNNVAPIIQAWFQSNDMRIGDAAALTWAKLNRLDEHGLQPGNTIRHDFVAGVFGSFATNPDWNQTYAMTLRTAKSRGRAHAGRIFPPLVGYNPTGKTPYIDPVAANIMATATATLIGDITTALSDTANPLGGASAFSANNFEPAIVSPGSIAGGTVEMRERITSVVVDRVPDTQHRRTRQVPRLEGNNAPVTYDID